MPESLTDLLSSLAVGLTAAYAAVQFALRRFYSERWWERKAEAYAAILNALAQLKRYTVLLAAEERDGEVFAPSYKKTLETKHMEAFHEVERQTAVGDFLISSGAAAALAALQARPDFGSYDGPPLFYLEGEAEALGKTIAQVRQEAKHDLKVQR